MEAADRAVIGQRETWTLIEVEAHEVDAEGRTSRETDDRLVRGRVDELSARDIEVAARRGQTHDIVCLADHGVPVNDRCLVRVTKPTGLAGLYKVDRVRTTRRGLRVLCSRTTVASDLSGMADD